MGGGGLCANHSPLFSFFFSRFKCQRQHGGRRRRFEANRTKRREARRFFKLNPRPPPRLRTSQAAGVGGKARVPTDAGEPGGRYALCKSRDATVERQTQDVFPPHSVSG